MRKRDYVDASMGEQYALPSSKEELRVTDGGVAAGGSAAGGSTACGSAACCAGGGGGDAERGSESEKFEGAPAKTTGSAEGCGTRLRRSWGFERRVFFFLVTVPTYAVGRTELRGDHGTCGVNGGRKKRKNKEKTEKEANPT